MLHLTLIVILGALSVALIDHIADVVIGFVYDVIRGRDRQ